MLDGQREVIAVAVAAQVEVAVAPGVELGGAAQGLAGADAIRCTRDALVPCRMIETSTTIVAR
jgi:hypothetical protein